MNLQQELAALRARIDELEAQAKTEATDSWPKYGNECWAIDGDGDLFDFVWNLEDNQLHRLEIGNVFRTEEEAKREVERRKVLTELRKLAKASGKRDWGNRESHKFEILHCRASDAWRVESRCTFQRPGSVYFATEQSAKAAIETIGADRLMLLLED